MSEDCGKVLVSEQISKMLKLSDAIDFAMEYTLKNDLEVVFEFDKKKKRLSSPIIQGCEHVVQLHGDKDSRNKVVFHTHTHDDFNGCVFSIQDLIATSGRADTSAHLGCPSYNALVSLNMKKFKNIAQLYDTLNSMSPQVIANNMFYIKDSNKLDSKQISLLEEMVKSKYIENIEKFKKNYLKTKKWK